MRKKIYNGTDHPDVANTFYSIAQQYSNLGQYEKALQAFENVLGKPIKKLNLIWEQGEAQQKSEITQHTRREAGRELKKKHRRRNRKRRWRNRSKNDDDDDSTK